MTNTTPETGVRRASVHELAPGSVARGQNFWVQWIEGAAPVEATSLNEMLLLLPDGGATVHAGAEVREVPGRSVCVLPAGAVTVRLAGTGQGTDRAALVASSRPDLAPGVARNQTDYAVPDARVRPVGDDYHRRASAGAIRVMEVDAIQPPADKPRLKMFQTDTLSINWVEYQEARDRTQLSPHNHADFEQGSLAMAGDFVHHLRVNWGGNADQWRDDEHLHAPSPSMITVPVLLVHTTEGVGPGRHLLIDVFSPPRHDFIDKGWVANAGDYERRKAG
ncbi:MULTISPECIES: hypothetical protein [Variovorax]|jgi:hypothetical protein|uniref:hypothetical protein n=1 Tax=Variovorax TaxID=34072 RepID=UPI00086A0EFF|nr:MULTISPECIES: hypothetical protein [Variovorax]MBN8754712.1 hypothetical protein [Variovorax sp.]ODU19425.1 MAG: hypothetical protein ABS94_00800 [Variovorax sp. SCN 67-85]ODV25326.1 MAG: hypothetical protein ABT25_11140 [Variovorax sp. SCN 67-20]OJZ03144.1 MAG: hypothetical protein BGP22_00795 [Variovorax sp. 67-131]UKI08233.1 hypothetical protein L3V85_36570 [Variovorax paradoxus]